jgi:hypothetical protein
MSSENNDDTLELTAILSKVDDDKYITVSAPTNLPGGYELNVDSDGSHWTVQVVRENIRLYVMLLQFVALFLIQSYCRIFFPSRREGLRRTKPFTPWCFMKVP